MPLTDIAPPVLVTCPACGCEFAVNASPATTPNASLVLSLDGGGIKGYSTLLILEEIMKKVCATERALMMEEIGEVDQKELDRLNKPCNYFDYMVGTSTGGLIAIMLSRLKMSIEDCLTAYRTLGGQIFGKPRTLHVHNKLWLASKFDSTRLQSVLQKTIEDYGGGNPDQIFHHVPASGEHHCKTAVVACKEGEHSEAVTWLFRSYLHERSPGAPFALNPDEPDSEGCQLKTWEVARATSAAPSYFKVLKTSADGNFLDGGLYHNNPVLLACNEAWHMARLQDPTVSIAKAIGCVISIGTGTSKYQVFAKSDQSALGKYLNLQKAPRSIITETDGAHKEKETQSAALGVPYYRFNVREGLEKTKLDDWGTKKRPHIEFEAEKQAGSRRMSTVEYLELVTRKYLSEDCAPVDGRPDSIGDCARLLVAYRRARQSPVVQNGVGHR